MVRHGMTPMTAIEAATVNAADLLGLSAEVGTIEPGKSADIVAVRGDPLRRRRRAAPDELRHGPWRGPAPGALNRLCVPAQAGTQHCVRSWAPALAGALAMLRSKQYGLQIPPPPAILRPGLRILARRRRKAAARPRYFPRLCQGKAPIKRRPRRIATILSWIWNTRMSKGCGSGLASMIGRGWNALSRIPCGWQPKEVVMLSKKLAALVAISLLTASSAAVAQTAQPLSLANAPASRAGAATTDASDAGRPQRHRHLHHRRHRARPDHLGHHRADRTTTAPTARKLRRMFDWKAPRRDPGRFSFDGRTYCIIMQ